MSLEEPLLVRVRLHREGGLELHEDRPVVVRALREVDAVGVLVPAVPHEDAGELAPMFFLTPN